MEVMLQQPPPKRPTLTRAVVGVSVGLGKASVVLSWRKSPEAVVSKTVHFMVAQSE
jgi:hypothetical protein